MTSRAKMREDYRQFLGKCGLTTQSVIDRRLSDNLSARYAAPIDKFFLSNKRGWSLALSVDEAQKLKDFLVSMLEER